MPPLELVIEREGDRLVGLAVEVKGCLRKLGRARVALRVIGKSIAFRWHAERVGVQLPVAVLVVIAGYGVFSRRKIAQYEGNVALAGVGFARHLGKRWFHETRIRVVDGDEYGPGCAVYVFDGNGQSRGAGRDHGKRAEC